jgi:ribosome modulation factor
MAHAQGESPSLSRGGPCTLCAARALRQARDRGYQDGLHNRHGTLTCYSRGDLWLAWLEGWRQGQAELGTRLAEPDLPCYHRRARRRGQSTSSI